MTAPVRPRVLYVGGMPRSGTTLMTWMLGQLPGHTAVGELFYLWTAALERDQLCGCGEHFHACPFWTEVGERAFGGWDQVDRERMATLVDRVDRTSRIPALLASRVLPGVRAELEEYAGVMARLYAAAAEVAGVEVSVDGSKRPSLAAALAISHAVDLRVVHVVRDPRGVVYSWSRQVALPEGASSRGHLKARSARLITRRWLTVNAMIGGLRRLGVPVLTVRYEDLARRPREALAEVADFAGVDEPGALDFVTDEGLHLAPAHMVEGGRVRFQPSPLTVRLDDAWHEGLAPRRRRAVDLATRLSRRRYGYR